MSDTAEDDDTALNLSLSPQSDDIPAEDDTESIEEDTDASAESDNDTDYSAMTVAALRNLAKDRGLCNVYYAVITGYDVLTKKYTYGTPIPIPGGVSVSFSASGDSNPFYADNIVYFDVKTNAGYEGDLEIALIPDSFRINVLGEEEMDGMLVENSDAQGKEFALMQRLRKLPRRIPRKQMRVPQRQSGIGSKYRI